MLALFRAYIGRRMFNELTIAYLFFGGLGAGITIVLSILYLLGMKQNEPYCLILNRQGAATGYALASLALLLGVSCLIADLPNPDKALMLFVKPTFTPLSVGSFALAATLVISALMACRHCSPAFWRVGRIAGPLSAAGIAFAAITVLYPGALLMSMIKDTVWHSALVPALFFLSSLSMGIAVVALCSCKTGRRTSKAAGLVPMLRVDSWLLGAKALVTVCYLVRVATALGGAEEMRYLFAGEGFLPFCIGYLGCGLLAAFIVERAYVSTEKHSLLIWLAALALVGGYCLRVFVIGLQLQ